VETAVHAESLKILYDADEKRRVVIRQRSDGNFGWAKEYWFENFYEGELIAKGWAYRPTENSVFETPAIAEREARARFSWLR
jgi:hypothetical protein